MPDEGFVTDLFCAADEEAGLIESRFELRADCF